MKNFTIPAISAVLLPLFLVMLLSIVQPASSIGCFICSSINGSNPDCEDTFNNTSNYYHAQCHSARKGRMGKFPGTECIKMTAHLDVPPYRVIVRDCVVDSGDTNSETEIGRTTHCGLVNTMQYNGMRVHGCILSCDTDGCNHSNKHSAVIEVLFIHVLISLYFVFDHL